MRSRSILAALGAAALATSMAVPLGVQASAATAPRHLAAVKPQLAAATSTTGCQLGGGIKHVIEIAFDNVHFFRDNPNVLSDIEQMPALENFIEGNGTLDSNEHTPLIAHTADDTLTTYTGLYGDRQGQGVSNDYEFYNGQGSGGVDSAASFAYWNGPIDDTTQAAASGSNPIPPTTGTGASSDPAPSMVYSSTVPATEGTTNGVIDQAPAPWVPFTRAGCDVGDVATANQVLENVSPDVNTVFGSTSPEEAQVQADSNSYKDQESNDYLGLAIHCTQGSALCANATAVKYGQTAPSSTAVTDSLPTEPGGYTGYQALYGNRYIAPVLDGGQANLVHTANGDSYQVTDAAGNLVDLSGNEIDGPYKTQLAGQSKAQYNPGFPGYGGITPAQSLAYVADMQEAGVPVTYAYISDVHQVQGYPINCATRGCYPTNCSTISPSYDKYKDFDPGYAIGSGDPCYYQNTAAYNTAFQAFFQRLADDGINKSNTLFIFSSDEGDHESGANVGRALQPSCTGTALTTGYTCSYTEGNFGEDEVAVHGLLQNELGDTTPFYNEPQGNSVYVTGSPTTAQTRQLERDFGAATFNDPYTGDTNQPLTDYLADQEEEQLLHFVTADPARTPTFNAFPDPDVYMDSGTSDSPACASGVTQGSASTACSTLNQQYSYNHGYYAPEINTSWFGMVGPGVANLGVNGPGPGDGPSSAGANSGTGLVPTNLSGTWTDETDLRPTLMALTGLTDDYVEDGRVVTEDLTAAAVPTGAQSSQFEPLAVCYKQLNASVGRFGNDTLVADTNAVKSGSASDDSTYTAFQSALSTLGSERDSLATTIKDDLYNAEFGSGLSAQAPAELAECNTILQSADVLAATGALPSPPASTPETSLAVALPAVGVALLGGVLVVRRRRHRSA